MKKIVFTGPESTGKTTISEQVAAHFGVPHIFEAARLHLKHQRALQPPILDYTYKDLSVIAYKQLVLENVSWEFENAESLSKIPFIVCDTDLITLKIWSNEVFGKCDPMTLQNIDNQALKYDKELYFLCSTDGVEWEPDPLRENPHDRDRLFKIYEKELIFYKKNYKILRGPQDVRFAAACLAIEQLLG
jgi:nicotinamide riboside kinase